MSARETLRAEAVVAEVERRWGEPCGRCALPLLGHDVVIGLLLGRGTEPRCASCLAAELGREPRAFLREARENVRRLDCFRAGWVHADRRLAREQGWPAARLPPELRLDGTQSAEDEPLAEATPSADHVPAVAVFDAGDLACGELVLELRRRLARLLPGERLEVLARDPAAPQDLPAWCRLTRHRLVAIAPPHFLIEKRSSET